MYLVNLDIMKNMGTAGCRWGWCTNKCKQEKDMLMSCYENVELINGIW